MNIKKYFNYINYIKLTILIVYKNNTHKDVELGTIFFIELNKLCRTIKMVFRSTVIQYFCVFEVV